MASPEQNKPWSPPDGSNNGSDKCWVNAPLYTILSNDEIRERVKNIGNPTENEPSGLSNALKLPTMGALKKGLAAIDNLTDKDVPKIEQDRPICVGLANAENNTLLNRLHITIFLLVVRNALVSVEGYNVVLPNKINATLGNFSIDSLRGDLSLLYGPAIKQFIDPDIPWTDVLYRTFALFMLKQGGYDDVNPNMVIRSASGSAMDTLGFIQNLILEPLGIIIVYTPELKNDQNTISIVAATKCTSTTGGQGSEHFDSFVKKNDIWFRVDALHGQGIGNFTALQKTWEEIENIHNCTDEQQPTEIFAVDNEVEFESGQDWPSGKIKNINGSELTISHGMNGIDTSTVNISSVRWPKKTRTMFSISYTPLPQEKARKENLTEAAAKLARETAAREAARIATETEAARIARETAAREAAAAAEQERLAAATATEEQKPSPFFQTIIEQLPKNSTSQLPKNSTSQPNKGYIKLLNIAFTRYNQNEPLLADGKLSLDKFKPSNINGKQVNYSPITDDNNFKQFDTDINALYRAATAAKAPESEPIPYPYNQSSAGRTEWERGRGGGKKTRKARPLQKKPVKSNRTRSRNRDGKKRIH